MIVAALVLAFLVGGHPQVTCVPDSTFGGHAGYVQDGNVELVQTVCDNLRPSSSLFGFALFVTVHEAEHLLGVEDEHAADCAALRALPRVLTRFWPRLGPVARLTVLYEARDAHARQPAPYGGPCQ